MDFRESIRVNNRKTKLVVLSYIAIMLLVGLLADIAIRPLSNAGLLYDMKLYLSLAAIPYFTLGVLACTLIGIFIINKFGHKMMLSGSQYRELDPTGTLSDTERQVANMVEEMAISANLGYLPRTFIMESEQMNAFAAGWNKDNALVAVTSGLLSKLTRSEVQAVIAHEVGHILHGDSKLTLYVGILANVILTLTNIFAHVFLFSRSRNSNANKAKMLLMVLNFVLPLITQVLYLYLSRSREYMADAASVQLTGDNQAMISALQKISGDHQVHDSASKLNDEIYTEKYRAAAYIFNKGDSVFSTHPSIENRLKKLRGE
ncbi:zinc metalloprotease HtpX [Oceanisphaera pacifica]|uniref:Zinc metalloprotease HtpX n=1 Tax=Oceanisphaera pacifica TaxID=2818389 RepID=A0ABS3NCJ9_9GAMM|nr:zinc metalloprotease HtpX [Oceanisphaera pacifica]MBO1518324.1 zinc metalloprotease HtpX [Oceanisphaera pacifica]